MAKKANSESSEESVTPSWDAQAVTIAKVNDNLYRVLSINVDSNNGVSSPPELIKECTSRSEAIEYFKLSVVKAGLFG